MTKVVHEKYQQHIHVLARSTLLAKRSVLLGGFYDDGKKLL